ncbi:Hypothetical predicted protein [Prunus dulcis]|uniref:Uncharacterized protein n=1 Tax=Prunus dulcis TaxID=3755 RepID=A0A5E4F6Z4_PRUDU|nr:Hypothetical predicted protein [Prunus dulcis]
MTSLAIIINGPIASGVNFLANINVSRLSITDQSEPLPLSFSTPYFALSFLRAVIKSGPTSEASYVQGWPSKLPFQSTCVRVTGTHLPGSLMFRRDPELGPDPKLLQLHMRQHRVLPTLRLLVIHLDLVVQNLDEALFRSGEGLVREVEGPDEDAGRRETREHGVLGVIKELVGKQTTGR